MHVTERRASNNFGEIGMQVKLLIGRLLVGKSKVQVRRIAANSEVIGNAVEADGWMVGLDIAEFDMTGKAAQIGGEGAALVAAGAGVDERGE